MTPQYKEFVEELRRESDYYPKILKKTFGNGIYLSTVVRMFKEKWYVIHVVESIIPNRYVNIEDLYKRLIQQVYSIQIFYNIRSHDEIDPLQISESERLTKY